MTRVETFYDEATFTLTYVVYDSSSKDAVIIDPVLNYDPAGSVTSTESADTVITFIEKNALNVHYLLETHAHADHLSGSPYLKEKWPAAKIAIDQRITKVQEVFKGVFNLPQNFSTNGSQFDQLLTANETYQAGSIAFKVLPTPGHTPACSSFLIEDMVFTGDALFMPDFGTGRCDFPAGDADVLYDSITNVLYQLPDDTKVFVGHDYQPGGRDLKYETTIGESKEANVHLRTNTRREDFVEFRRNRDKGLAAPKLLLPSVQVNINAGRLPEPEENGVSYLKIPVRKNNA